MTMPPLDPEKLPIGAYVVVRYGRFGEQLARFYGRRSWDGPYRVEKWRANSRRWTTAVALSRSEFLREATAVDLEKFRPASTSTL